MYMHPSARLPDEFTTRRINPRCRPSTSLINSTPKQFNGTRKQNDDSNNGDLYNNSNMHVEGSFRSRCLLKIVVSFSVLLVAAVSLSSSSQEHQHRNTATTTAVANGCTRRELLVGPSALCIPLVLLPAPSSAKCTDIESCREIGDKRKVEQDLKENPIIVLEESGVRYKQLIPGYGDKTVEPAAFVDLIYSISTGGSAYMYYSQGFGYEKSMLEPVLLECNAMPASTVTASR
jgi:hypothetical protein